MSFIRPEARDAIWRWREVLAGTALAAAGVLMAVGGRGTLAILGAIAMALGIGLVAAGWQRGRFRQGRGGAGVVQVTEGQVTYFGPFTGGTAPVAAIHEVILDPATTETPEWELRVAGGRPIRIPVAAEGAETLFDVFGALPGFPTERMLALLDDPGTRPVVIWTKRLLH